ncbi:MAG: enoyl-CoA hydratase/isomerase family protein [Paracoccus sp. (in: a-proteobacteria)]|uniref:enoyl-CoA hydratase/isomerase family protein n=1 Tax=Paracoccus sp. TaxID=267 RepID=UPI0039E5C6E0
MTRLSDYRDKYENVSFERQDGVLTMRLHTDGGPLMWSLQAHTDLPEAFLDVGRDRDNKVVILTGTGDWFSGPQATPTTSSFPDRPDLKVVDRVHWEGRHLQMNLLNIEVPMIAAVNGPAWRHSELPLLCDIVLASESAKFQDSGHFQAGLVPGDGMHIVYPLLLGMNRGRHFLLTGKIIEAREALDLGLVAEVLPEDALMARAQELAADLARRPTLLLRYTRLLLTEHLRRSMQDLLGYGLAMESIALFEKPEGAA